MSILIENLPEKYKKYEIALSNKKSIWVMGDVLERILASPNQLVRLPTGEGLNKAHIVAFTIDKAQTKDIFKALPQSEVDQIEKDLTLPLLHDSM